MPEGLIPLVTMKIQSTYISSRDNKTLEDVLAAVESSQAFPISNANWKEFPYTPQVSFRIAHTDKALIVLFDVTEDHVRATSLESNGPVWEDSCVEVFLAVPGQEGYFNFESNCIGTSLAAYRRSRTEADLFGPEQMEMIYTAASLPHKVIDIQEEGQQWSMLKIIPFSLLGLSGKPDMLKANFYKCGDLCIRPHYLSWSPIDTPEPNFHHPEFFGEIIF